MSETHTKLLKLYEIRREIEAALAAENEDGGFDSAELDALQLAFEEKASACIRQLKNLKASADAISAEIQKLTTAKTALENNHRRLADYLKHEMEALGKPTIQAGIHKARIAKSPITVQVIDEGKIDDHWKKVETVETVLKKEIIAHLKETGEIPSGVEIVQSTHLRVS